MNFERKTKSILYGMEFTHGMRRALLISLALVYFLSLGFDVVAVTTLFAVSTFIMLIFEFPTSAIADYDSRKKSLIISFFLMFVAFFGIFWFDKFWILAGFWVIGDVAWSFSSGASSAWAIDNLAISEKKDKIVDLVSGGYFYEKWGHLVGGIIGLFIIGYNFRFIWLFISAICFVMVIIIILFMEERNFSSRKVPYGYIIKIWKQVKKSFVYFFNSGKVNLRILMLAGFLGTISISSFFIGVPILFTQVLGLDVKYLPLVFSGFATIAILSPAIAKRMSKTTSLKNSLFIITMVIGLAIMVFTLSGSLLYSLIAMGILGISLTVMDVLEDSFYQFEFSSELRASLGSFSSIQWALGDSIGVFLAGIGIGYLGVVNMLTISGIFLLITGFIYLIGGKE